MQLYHFTSYWHLRGILTDREINCGEVALSPTKIVTTVVNLTTNGDAATQLWFEELGNVFEIANPLFTPDVYTIDADKVAVRLTLEIPDKDRRLQRWDTVCIQKKISPACQRAMDPGKQGREWYVYWGAVPVDWITDMEFVAAPRSPKDKEAEAILQQHLAQIGSNAIEEEPED